MCVCSLGLVTWVTGCTHSSSPQTTQKKDAALSQVSGEALVDDVIRYLNRLDEATIVDLTPPELVLDSTTSRNRKEVSAVLVDAPQQPTGSFDILHVVTNNGQFDRLKVRPGDQVRIFVLLPDEFGRQDDFRKRTGINMVVREVLDPNTLRVMQNPFGQPLMAPERIEIWRYSEERLRDLGARFERYWRLGKATSGFALPRGKELPEHEADACWEPTPDESALISIIDRLNQWARGLKTTNDWQPSPLVQTLPEHAQKILNPASLSEDVYSLLDVRTLQEAVWARDIAMWAATDPRFVQPLSGPTPGVADKVTVDLELATALFDWTTREIQLEASTAKNPAHLPWHTLLYGRGTAEERAAVFALLARQKDLTVVQLGLLDKKEESPRFWLSALFSGDQLYLFDPRLGLPIPGPGGKGIATLQQAQQQPEILAQLDLDAEHSYGITPEELQQVVALVDVSRLGLSHRGQLIEERLAGNNKFVLQGLSSDSVERLRKSPGVQEVRLWDFPYRTLDAQLSLDQAGRLQAQREFLPFAFRPWLFKGRVMHFQGKFDYEMIVKLYDAETAERYDKRSARYYYRFSRASNAEINDERRPEQDRDLMRISKFHASYYLGLLALDDTDYHVAVDFFAERTLAETPDGPWTAGAIYNLGRTYELLGDPAHAIAEYELRDDLPQSLGNHLRARWLKALASSNTQPAEKQEQPSGEEKTTEKQATEEKPAEKKPDEKKPAEQQPAEKAVEPQPPAEAKPDGGQA